MSMTYLDTLAVVVGSGEEGVSYAGLSRAMKVHVRSLHTEGVVAAFVGDEVVSLDTAKAVICLTSNGASYADLLAESGLIQTRDELVAQGVAKPRKRTTRRRKTSSRKHTVPTPSESVASPVNPEGRRMVPGNALGDQMAPVPVASSPEDDRIAALERKISALMAVIAS